MAEPTALDLFEASRPKLHGVAYRMTGSVSDADDICQEAWLRWQAVDQGEIDEPEAYLVRITTRLCLDRLQSAAARREHYVGPWLPEPLVSDLDAPGRSTEGDPEHAAELADSLTFAFLVMLDELDPVARAVLLLHDVFGYSFREVAASVDRSEAAVRQLASRARQRVRSNDRPTLPASDPRLGEIMTNLLVSLNQGDVEAVMACLAPDVVSLDDGGPKQRAARRPVVGNDRVARLWVNLAKRGTHLVPHFAEVNARPGLVLYDGDRPFIVMSVDIDAETGQVVRIFSQLNPDKLAHLH